ncbi:hypothetical protein ACQEVB_39695 [Pseudonocardia sp. CA-107938]|uniref:hypothetical protein n=1 Tax=Pseudonocardia sp. CA-107938 TaxID=3240021 RepID=UPI003D935F75
MLGVYPSALHVRWRRPDGATIGALAVDDEPEVFWDGADAAERIAAWLDVSEWSDGHGTISHAGGNGSSGRSVVDDVLTPLRVAPRDTYFTDCLPFYFTKTGAGSQGQRIAELYQPFAAAQRLSTAALPSRPSPTALVRRTLAEESDSLRGQLAEAAADRVITLGQEAADVFAALAAVEPVTLRPDDAYGAARTVRLGGKAVDWIPLTHPGNHHSVWRERHTIWMRAQS